MPRPANLCPFCRGLNSAGERRCYRCGRSLPGPLLSGVINFFRDSFGGEGAITRALVGFCLLVFALGVLSEHHVPWVGRDARDNFALSTVLRFGGIWRSLGVLQPWRYLAAVFCHFSLLHVGMNCWVLTSVGQRVEHELGKARFVILFTLSGALGFVISDAWVNFDSLGPTAGASGAVFGLFGAAIGLAYARRDPNWKQILVQNLIWIVVISVLGSANNAAHFGGLVVGAGLGFAFEKEPSRLKQDLPFGVIATLLLLLCLLSVGLCAVSPIWRAVQAQENGLLR